MTAPIDDSYIDELTSGDMIQALHRISSEKGSEYVRSIIVDIASSGIDDDIAEAVGEVRFTVENTYPELLCDLDFEDDDQWEVDEGAEPDLMASCIGETALGFEFRAQLLLDLDPSFLDRFLTGVADGMVEYAKGSNLGDDFKAKVEEISKIIVSGLGTDDPLYGFRELEEYLGYEDDEDD